MSLYAIDYGDGTMDYPHRRSRAAESDLRGYIAEAHELLGELATGPRPEPFGMPNVSADFEALRWFPFPDEIEPDTPVSP